RVHRCGLSALRLRCRHGRGRRPGQPRDAAIAPPLAPAFAPRRPPAPRIAGACFALALAAGRAAHGQQAIVSLPSADITPAGESFVMHESQARPFSPKPYWNTTNFFCYGLGYNAELAVTTFNLGTPYDGRGSVAFGYKAFTPLFDDVAPWAEVRLTHGVMGLVDVDDGGAGHWLYAHLSARAPALGTRATAGISEGSALLFQRRVVSFMAALEQPLGTPKLNAVVEWFSGEHDLGNLIGGVTFHPDHTWIFVAGYKVPTSGPAFSHAKQAFVFEVGAFF
ncbi:MAG TPA: hypothetical protein VFS00_33740, partial [Polyangiaceae bacterium]|nr:hypothetical protein [Polyangiaceae bacterium]